MHTDAYRPEDIRALIEPERVHRDLYVSEALFRLECERLFRRSWIYLGHGSQIPQPGDYATAQIAGEPLMMVRQADGRIAVLLNRCAHKGAPLALNRAGRFERALRCPYHSWSYRLDGSPLAVPMPEGYDGTGLPGSTNAAGLTRVPSAEHRGFVFARLAAEGPDFAAYFGAMLDCIDAMADRSPEGVLEVAGPPLRTLIRCNWKIYLENIPDAVHAAVTHESAIAATEAVWAAWGEGAERPVAIEQLSPFGAGSGFVEDMGGRVYPNGHMILGTRMSLHSHYAAVPGYEAAMQQAYGEARARRILGWSPQNALFYPSLAIKASPQTLRVVRPLAADRTLVESWTLRPRGAPEAFVERTQLYNRLVFSPMSIVAHDDVRVFEGTQRALQASANPWVSLHRGFSAAEAAAAPDAGGAATSGSSERLMRNQYRAWLAALVGPAAPEGCSPATGEGRPG